MANIKRGTKIRVEAPLDQGEIVEEAA